jgi:hypothetical protein
MLDDGILEKRGKSKATRYFWVGAKAKPVEPSKPDTKPSKTREEEAAPEARAHRGPDDRREARHAPRCSYRGH